MLKLFRNLLNRAMVTQKYTITAMRQPIPMSRQRVFATFVIEATSLYHANRQFDQEYTAWRRV